MKIVISEGIVRAVCISEKTGTRKHVVKQCNLIAGQGIEGDGHINTHRQISLLMIEDIERYNICHKNKATPGDFAENFVTEGIDLEKAAVGYQIRIGESTLQVCQIGKEVLPHHYSFNGDRLLPTRGVFCKVLTDGIAYTDSVIELMEIK